MDMQWLENEVVGYRRDFHQFAEAGWTEFRTSSKIAEILSALGYEVLVGKEILDPAAVMGRASEAQIAWHMQRALGQGANPVWMDRMGGYTGVIGILDTQKPGSTIALRFDIDANDVNETEDPNHRPNREGFASVNKAVMHACGHDGHAAMGLGLAHVLAEIKEELRGKVKLIFQPAEEGVRGAKAIVEKGFLDDVDYLFGGHVGFNTAPGTISAGTKGFLCTTKIDVTYTGKGSHAGAAPNEGNNALLAAASATLNLHAIAPHKDGSTRINVGVLQGGVGRNVIAPNAKMMIETRGQTKEINEYVYDRAVQIIEHTAKMYGIDYRIDKMGEAVNCESDLELMDFVKKVGKDLEEITEIVDTTNLGGSEDISFMMHRVQEKGGKATYMMLGTTTAAGHHNEGFDFEESVLFLGVKLFKTLVLKRGVD